MVTSLNTNVPARDTGEQQIHYISGRHTLTAADTPAYTKIGSLPIGAMIVGITTLKATAVTGGTPVLGVGSASSTVGTNGDIQNVLAETAGTETVVPLATFTQPTTAVKDVYIGTTGGATAGDVYAVVAYIPTVA